jgi:hypothetical protein
VGGFLSCQRSAIFRKIFFTKSYPNKNSAKQRKENYKSYETINSIQNNNSITSSLGAPPCLLWAFATSASANQHCLWQWGAGQSDQRRLEQRLWFRSAQSRHSGKNNTATGLRSLFSDTSGSYDTATGVYALYGNTTGFYNTAVGAFALANNISGNYNTANGYGALYYNTANNNTATGYAALYHNTTGQSNTGNGVRALEVNTDGDSNTANGAAALAGNTVGSNNTASGNSALFNNTTGSNNTANGVGALNANSTGSNNTAVGNFAGSDTTTGHDNVYIGAGINGLADESNACRIASIFGQTAANGSAVFITSGNKLGTDTCSRRFKEAIRPMDKASEALLALKPVTFRYKKEIDPDGRAQFGLVAEEVEKVNPDLVVRDKEGKPYSVRYDQVNAMLLNEFLKEHRKVQDLEATVTQQQKGMEALSAQLKEQAAQIQKVSAQIEVNKPTPKVVLNNQ